MQIKEAHANHCKPDTVEPLVLGHLHSGDRHKIWCRKNAHIISLFVTSIKGTPLYSRDGDAFSGSRNPVLISFQGTP